MSIYCYVIGSSTVETTNGEKHELPSCPYPGCRHKACPYQEEAEVTFVQVPKATVLASAKAMLINRKTWRSMREDNTTELNLKPSVINNAELEEAELTEFMTKAAQETITSVIKEEQVPTNYKLEGVKMGQELNMDGSIKGVTRSLDIGIIGVGGCGNHIADAFAKAGYDAQVINLTDRDFAHLENIPSDDLSRIEMITTAGGAGKDPDVGARAVQEYENILLKKIQRKFNNKEFIFICFGLGGGTGSLGGTKVAELTASLGIPVGVIVTLPRTNEGTDEKVNCLRGLQEVANCKSIKSIVVIDNQRVLERLKDVKASDFWTKANQEIVSLFDSFNRYSAEAADTAFDAEDYKKVLMTPGFLVIGSSEILTEKIHGAADTELAEAIQSIAKGMLATGFDHSTAIRVAGVVVKPPKELFEYSHVFEEALYDHLKSEIGAGTLNRGIYENKGLGNYVIVKTMLAGMKLPQARIQQLVSETKSEAHEMSRKVNERNTETVSIDIPTDFNIISGSETRTARKR
jgi:cell division GTPase FtsZ